MAKQIKNFDKISVELVAAEVEAAVAAIAAKHGLTFTRGRGRYGNDHFRIANIEFQVAGDSAAAGGKKPKGVATKRQELAYESARIFDKWLPALGTIIKDGRQELKIYGWNPRAPKNPILLLDVATGKTFKAPTGWLKSKVGA